MLKKHLFKPRRYYIAIAVFIIFVAAIAFFLMPKEIVQLKIIVPQLSIKNHTIEQRLKPGMVGEIEEQEAAATGSNLPVILLNTSGIVKEIGADTLIVQGSGSNFADKKPRTLVSIFSESTIVMKLGSKDKDYGLQGLSQLEPGTKVLIQGDENIRGKTRFVVSYVFIK